MARILGVGGSPRRKGNSDILLARILAGARQEGATASSVHLRDVRMDPCIGCEKCRKARACVGLTDGMTTLYPRLEEARGLALACPTHNYNVTAWMKAFIDRLYCYYEFDDNRPRGWSSRLAGQGRKAVLAAVAEQAGEYDMGFTLEAMARPLEALGFEIVGRLPVLLAFDRGAVARMPEAMAKALELGRTLARSLS